MKSLNIILIPFLLLTGGCKLKQQLNGFGDQKRLEDSLFLVLQEERQTRLPIHDFKTDTLYEKLNAIENDPLLNALKVKVDLFGEFISNMNERLYTESHSEGDMETPQQIMIEQGNAGKLKTDLEELALIMNKLSPTDSVVFQFVNEVPESVRVTWIEYNFDRIPMIAVVTILTHFQQIVEQAEHELLVDLYKSKSDIKSQTQPGQE